MHVVRARALYSMTRIYRSAKCRLDKEPQIGFRTFLSSPICAARPDDPNAPSKDDSRPDKPAEQGAERTEGNGTAAEPETSGSAEPLRDVFSGVMARSRIARGRNQDPMPPVSLPEQFINERVLLFERDNFFLGDYESTWKHPWVDEIKKLKAEGRPVDMSAISEDERKTVQDLVEIQFEAVSWTPRKIANVITAIQEGDLALVTRRSEAVRRLASILVTALAYRGDVDSPGGVDLRRIDPEDELYLPWILFERSALNRGVRSLKVFPRIYIEKDMDEKCLLRNAKKRHPTERPLFRELRSTIRAELLAVAPSIKKEVRRPVSIVTILNYSGPKIAMFLVSQVASDLRADIINLDAATIAEIVGTYLGQTSYWNRGAVSMLGYTAAEKNGRMAPRYQARSDDESDALSFFSRRISDLTSGPTGRPYHREPEDKWDDLKMSHVLEEIVKASDLKHSSTSMSSFSRRVILHIHDYVELSMVPEGAQILNKLRSVVDRLWQKGQEIVIVGSTAADIAKEPDLRDKIEEMSKEDCYFIPYQVRSEDSISGWQKEDVVQDNIHNIRAMLTSLTGQPVTVSIPAETDGPEAQELVEYLSRTVYDVHFIYRYATQILGYRGRCPQGYDVRALLEAFYSMQVHDRVWERTNGGRGPYYSPLSTLTIDAELDKASDPKNTEPRRNDLWRYNEYERKLLPNLVKAKDIRTTFDDIVCPPETKESLRALTSLSLIRPEAFAYGVLSTERIPGCLLYGAPGTGKTLLAKAIAKQSGANMLEVSAASINDMWVGNSEKTVQALFSLAKKMSPMVIFLDEADSLLGARSSRPNRVAYRETVNQFLREWDGITDMKAFIMVATNRPFDLDEAVLRRLPRKILVDLPLKDGRLEILKVMLREEVLDSSVALEKLAAETELYSGSDLKNLCVAAAMEAVKEEVRANDSHTGPEAYVFPEKRILTGVHFDKALKEISASISEDMESLKAIRKFDERYGDSRWGKKRRHMGFEVVPNEAHTEDARIRREPI